MGGSVSRKTLKLRLASLLLLSLILVLAIDVLGRVASAKPDGIPNHVVISEVEIVDSEWIELYNPTNSDVDMSGWYWCYFSSERDWNKPVNHKELSGVIKKHGFYLLRIDGDAKPHGVDPDWDTGYSDDPNTLSDSAGSVGIFTSDPKDKSVEDAKAAKIDVVAWGNVSNVKEGTEATAPGSGKSIERKALFEGYAPCQDTDNNAEDFFERETPTPMNSSKTWDPAPPVRPIGGVVVPASKLELLAPWIGLAALACVILAGGAAAIKTITNDQ